MRLGRSGPLIVAAALYLVTGVVNLEVPLYRVYAAAAGWNNGLTAITFAAYVAGLLPVLLCLGGLSDRVGRKPVVLLGTFVAVAATALMILHPTIQVLLVARLLKGVGVGLSVGAGTAWLAELATSGDAAAAAANRVAVMTSLGFGSGALGTTLALLPGPTLVPVSYWCALLLGGVCFVALLTLPQRSPQGGVLVRLPYFPTGTVLPGIAIALAWAVTGLVIAIIPAQLARYDLGLWSGAALFLVNGTGALCQPLVRRIPARRALYIGFGLLPLGYLLLAGGAWRGILPLVLLGAAIAGSACYGFTYLGGLSEVSRLGGTQRARAVSGYFLCAYLGFGLPSILLGFLADALGVLVALLLFGVVLLIATIGLVGYTMGMTNDE